MNNKRHFGGPHPVIRDEIIPPRDMMLHALEPLCTTI